MTRRDPEDPGFTSSHPFIHLGSDVSVTAERNPYDGLLRIEMRTIGAQVATVVLTSVAVEHAFLTEVTTLLCKACVTPLAVDGHCPECVAEQTRWDH